MQPASKQPQPAAEKPKPAAEKLKSKPAPAQREKQEKGDDWSRVQSKKGKREQAEPAVDAAVVEAQTLAAEDSAGEAGPEIDRSRIGALDRYILSGSSLLFLLTYILKLFKNQTKGKT